MGDSNEAPRRFEDEYSFGKVLGDGNYSVVRECEHLTTHQKYAVKCIKKSALKIADLKNLYREIAVLKKLDHPNIIKMYDVFETNDMCYIVLELVTGGELFDRIIEKSNYTEAEAKVVIRSVAETLLYCHKMNMAHRDLKPENLLYQSPAADAPIKVADFGFAKLVTEDMEMKTMCGTPGYFAPEVVSRQPYEKKCDIWSLGVIMYILLCGFPPFYDENQIAEVEKIKRGEYDFPSPYFDEVSEQAKDLINRMLVVDASERYDAEDVLRHPWLSGIFTGTGKLPQLSHVGSNISDHRKLLRKKFRAGVNAVRAINRTKKLKLNPQV